MLEGMVIRQRISLLTGVEMNKEVRYIVYVQFIGKNNGGGLSNQSLPRIIMRSETQDNGYRWPTIKVKESEKTCENIRKGKGWKGYPPHILIIQ